MTKKELNKLLNNKVVWEAFQELAQEGKLKYLSEIDLSDCNLEEADFSGANLFSANLTNANLSMASMEGARVPEKIFESSGYDYDEDNEYKEEEIDFEIL